MSKLMFSTVALGAFVLGSVIGPQVSSVNPSHAASNFASSPFQASCTTGFAVKNVKKSTIAGVPAIVSYKCKTGWFKCPIIPNMDETRMKVNIVRNGGGDANVKTRVVYECYGYNIAG